MRHYRRWKRHGDPRVTKAVRDPLSYDAVHYQVRKVRGRADDFPCSAPECDAMARNWAWLRTGEYREGVNSHGHAIRWGLDIRNYAPMCASHARMMDAGGDLVRCPRGHVRAVVGRTKAGKCKGCHRS